MLNARQRRDRQWAIETREVLHAAFPACFAGKGDDKRPLKVGIYHDIRAAVPGIRARQLSRALGDYTGGAKYLKAMIAGAERVGLDGRPAGEVSDDAASHAAKRLARLNRRTAHKFAQNRAA